MGIKSKKILADIYGMRRVPALKSGALYWVRGRFSSKLKLFGTKAVLVDARVASNMLIFKEDKKTYAIDLSISQISIEDQSIIIRDAEEKEWVFRCNTEFELNEWMAGLQAGQRNDVRKSDFSFDADGYLGEGRFGKVYLGAHRETGELVALKHLEKVDNTLVSERRRRSVVEDVFTERIVLEKLIGTPFMVQLLYAFVDVDQPVIAMEYIAGGNTLDFVKNKKRLQLETVRFMAKELIGAVSFLHDRGIIHRDLKLENIMFDAQGHLKVVDFGLAKELAPLRNGGYGFTFTLCGTNYYMAPEVIRRTGTTLTADWFQVGCLVYEFITGSLAFYDKSPRKIHEKILMGEYDTSALAKAVGNNDLVFLEDFISKMLNKDPENRLGANGAKEVLAHPFLNAEDQFDLIREVGLAVPKDILSYLNNQEKKLLNLIDESKPEQPESPRKKTGSYSDPRPFVGFEFASTKSLHSMKIIAA